MVYARRWSFTAGLAGLLTLGPACDSASPGDQACTEIGCNSTLTLTFQHDLALDEPVLLEITTPNNDIRCSLDASPSGAGTCFGFAFSDLEWDESSVTVTLTEPFYVSDATPDGAPFSSVTAALVRGGETLTSIEVAVDPGEEDRPNGPDCPPVCWQATGAGDLR